VKSNRRPLSHDPPVECKLGGEVYEELEDGLGIGEGFNQSWNGVGVIIGLGLGRKIGSEDERIIGRGVDTTTDS